MDDFSDTRPMGLYEDAIGSKRQNYYLNKFEDFDQAGNEWAPSWNWGAFFGGGGWVLYRKMYDWFFAWVLFGAICMMLLKIPNPQIQQGVGIAYLACFLVFPIYANSIYHRKIKARIAAAQRASSDPDRVSRRLIAGSGVHTWLLILMLATPITGVVIALSVFAFKDYRTQKAEPIVNWDEYKLASPPENPYGKVAQSAAPLVDNSKNHPFTYEEAIAPPAQSTAEQEHSRRIYTAHADANAIYDSQNFKSWVAKYPTYQRILTHGNTQEIIDMFTAYKNQR